MSIMEQCIPRCTLPKRRKLPWVNSSIRRAISKRNNYWERSRQNPSHREKYKQSCNEVLLWYVRGKGTFQTLHSSNPKHFWKTVKLLNGKTSTSIPVIERNNIQLTTNQEKANVLNTFFHSCFNTALPPLSCTDACPEPSGSPEHIFCTDEEILEMILNLDATNMH